MRLETSALLVEVVVSMAVRSLEVEVPELAATLLEEDDGEVLVDEEGDVALAEEEGDVLLRLEELVSSFATELDDVPVELDAPIVVEGVDVVPLVSFALELSVELDFDEVSFAAIEADVSDFDVSDFEVSDAVDVLLELGEVLATDELLLGDVDELLLGDVADVLLLLGEVALLLWFEAVRLESEL
jgi:hypothetical protein